MHTKKDSEWQSLQKSDHAGCLGEMWFLDLWQCNTHSMPNGIQSSSNDETLSNELPEAKEEGF